MRTLTTATIATLATALVAVPATALITASVTAAPEQPRVATCATEDDTECFWVADKQGNGQGESFYTDANGTSYYVPNTDDVTAYGEAVKELRAAGERGDDLLPYLIELAEVDNNIRFGG